MKSIIPQRIKLILKNNFIIFLSFYTCVTVAQDESLRITNQLASPESHSSGSGNNSSVDMYRGTQNTTIPIYNFKGREFDLPISLNYVSTGIKVNQIANNVGLGWNLSVGGRITRVVRGVPDDFYTFANTYPDPCAQHEETCATCPYKDYYKADVMGFEDIFQFTNCPVCIASLLNPHVDIKIVGGIDNGLGDYTITAPDGTKYYFAGVRENLSTVLATCASSSITAWLLTKIVSKNNLDEYIFNYQNFVWTTPIPNNGEGYVEQQNNGPISEVLTNSSYKVNQQMVTEIFHNHEKIIGFNYTSRNDLVNVSNALSEIVFYNFNQNTAYKKAVFAYSYFGPINTNVVLEKRLKLDKLTFVGLNGSFPNGQPGDEYSFNYIDEALVPSITSFARDYLGLRNTKNANLNLLPYGHNRDFELNAPDGADLPRWRGSISATIARICDPDGADLSAQR